MPAPESIAMQYSPMLYRTDADERTGVQNAKASALRRPLSEGEPVVRYKTGATFALVL